MVALDDNELDPSGLFPASAIAVLSTGLSCRFRLVPTAYGFPRFASGAMASIQSRQPTHKAVILDLIKWVDDNSVYGVDVAGNPAPFMPTKDLREHLRDKNRLRDILKALFEPEEPPTNVSPAAIVNSCTSVFAILVRIQKGAYVSEFLRHRELFDHQLPFLTKPPAFPSIPNDDFYECFCKEQWRFCAHTFRDGHDDLHIPDSYILPILTTQVLDEGGAADVQKVTLHPEYDKIQPSTQGTEESGRSRKVPSLGQGPVR